MKDIKIFSHRNRNANRTFIGFYVLLAMIIIFVLSFSQKPVHAQSGSCYNLTWWTVDSGGETASQGGGYRLDSAAGQAEAAQFTSTGGGYSLQSGFWSGSAAKYRTWYYPLVLTP